MQEDRPKTPKMQRVRRFRNASTPELVRKNVDIPARSRHRSTMAPFDFALPQNLPKRKLGMERMSILPLTSSLGTSRILDAEHNDVEMKLLYDEYLQAVMTEIVMKKKTEEKEHLLLSQLATIAKERDHDEEKLFKLKAREKDIRNLTSVQNELEVQVTELDKCTEKEETKILKDTLSQLYSLLKPLDVLRCNNIILPETTEEGEELAQALKSCAKTLESIINLIGTQKDVYKDVISGMKLFLKTYNDIEDHQRKKLEKALCNLQILVLKIVSLSLMHNED